MAVSKVVYGNQTLIDLTCDTVTAGNLIQGVTAHGANGVQITGTAVIPTKTSELTNDSGFITSSDLSGYLPLTGGTLSGNLTISSSIAQALTMVAGAGAYRDFAVTGTNGNRIGYIRVQETVSGGAVTVKRMNLVLTELGSNTIAGGLSVINDSTGLHITLPSTPASSSNNLTAATTAFVQTVVSNALGDIETALAGV